MFFDPLDYARFVETVRFPIHGRTLEGRIRIFVYRVQAYSARVLLLRLSLLLGMEDMRKRGGSGGRPLLLSSVGSLRRTIMTTDWGIISGGGRGPPLAGDGNAIEVPIGWRIIQRSRSIGAFLVCQQAQSLA